MIFKNKQQGSILIFLLWIIAVISFIVSQFGREVRLKALEARNIIEASNAYFTAYSAVQELMVRLTLPDEDERKVFSGDEIELDINNEKVKVKIQDEERKININMTDTQPLIDLLTEQLKLSQEKAEEIADCVLDYRDGDNIPRPHGAEEDYYLELQPSYKPANASFKTINELLFVKGITPEIFWGREEEGEEGKKWIPGLYDFLTVYGKSVNLSAISSEEENKEKREEIIQGHYYRFTCQIGGIIFVSIYKYMGNRKYLIESWHEYYKPKIS